MKKKILIGLLTVLLLCLALMLLLRRGGAAGQSPVASPVPTSLPIADAEAWTVEDFVVEIDEEQAVEIH